MRETLGASVLRRFLAGESVETISRVTCSGRPRSRPLPRARVESLLRITAVTAR